VFHIDKTGVTQNQRQSLEPVTFTTTLMNMMARNKSQAWRLLGYIPSAPSSEKAENHQRDGVNVAKGRPTRDYHTCLHHIIKSFAENQGFDRPIYVEMKLGPGPPRKIRIFNVFAFVVGDCPAQDINVARFLSYSLNVKAICHACYVSPQRCNDPNLKCKFRHPHDVSRDNKVALQHPSFKNALSISPDLKITSDPPSDAQVLAACNRMANRSTHPVANGFRDVYLGANPYGIYGATPHDLFHLLLQGLYKYAIESIIGCLPGNHQKRLDRIGRQMC